MKKIIFMFIYSIGLFAYFYISFTGAHSSNYSLLISDAVESEDYDFFLKFNSLYKDSQLYTDDNYYITEVYNEYEDRIEINFLIKNLNLDEFKYDNNKDYTSLTIKGINGKYEESLLGVTYFDDLIYSINVPLATLLTECSDMNELIFTYPNKQELKVLVDINLNNISKDDININGYTDLEYKELFYISDYKPIIIDLIKYNTIAILLGSILIAVDVFSKKR